MSGNGLANVVALGRNRLLTAAASLVLLALLAESAMAIPYWARKYDLNCTACHVSPPKLNARGVAFQNRGYRPRADREVEPVETVPMAVWFTGRSESQFSREFGEHYLARAELIAGDAIGDYWNYFVEWRLVSLESRADGTLRDRSGRFEDAFLEWQPDDYHNFAIGQYRALQQVDVSLRKSVSEPAIFSTSLPGDPLPGNARVQSLRAFSPSGRSPSLTYSLQWLHGERDGDGMFHLVTVPFVGELSLPMTPEAQDEASFELHDQAKGVFLETFYRQELNSIGMHAFVGADRWLLTTVGTYNIGNLFLLGGVGVDEFAGNPRRLRSTLEAEYFLIHDPEARWRPGVGFRWEQVTRTGLGSAYIPYLTITGPNTNYAYLVQLEYRAQRDRHALLLDVSIIF